jgi:hypothetical protein
MVACSSSPDAPCGCHPRPPTCSSLFVRLIWRYHGRRYLGGTPCCSGTKHQKKDLSSHPHRVTNQTQNKIRRLKQKQWCGLMWLQRTTVSGFIYIGYIDRYMHEKTLVICFYSINTCMKKLLWVAFQKKRNKNFETLRPYAWNTWFSKCRKWDNGILALVCPYLSSLWLFYCLTVCPN